MRGWVKSVAILLCVAGISAGQPVVAQVEWNSPLKLKLGETSCRQMQRQKRQSWDLWKRSRSEVTGGMAFFPEKPQVDDLPDLVRMVIICDGEQGRVAALLLTLPRGVEREVAAQLSGRLATVNVKLEAQRGEGTWRDQTDYVTLDYAEGSDLGNFDLVYMTEKFRQQWLSFRARHPNMPVWQETLE